MLKSDNKKFLRKKNFSLLSFILLFIILAFFWINQGGFYQSSFALMGGKIANWFLKVKSLSFSYGEHREDSIESLKENNRFLIEENAVLREKCLKDNKDIRSEFRERFKLEEIEITGKESFFNQPLLFAIRKGEANVRGGLAVVDKDGFLVGVTDRVDARTLQVILAPNHRFRVGAKIAGTDWTGVVAGSHDLRSILTMLPLEAEPTESSPVITDNSNPDIPIGITVGTIAGVSDSADHLFKEALLDLHWKSETFLNLWVVTGKN